MLRTHELKDHTFDEIDTWGPIRQDIIWEVSSTYHITVHTSPGRFIFGRDMLFNIPCTLDWDGNQERKQRLIHKSNQAVSKSRVDHDYEVNAHFLIYRGGIYHKLEGTFLGPYNIVKI